LIPPLSRATTGLLLGLCFSVRGRCCCFPEDGLGLGSGLEETPNSRRGELTLSCVIERGPLDFGVVADGVISGHQRLKTLAAAAEALRAVADFLAVKRQK
jgi:hypothetical protein